MFVFIPSVQAFIIESLIGRYEHYVVNKHEHIRIQEPYPGTFVTKVKNFRRKAALSWVMFNKLRLFFKTGKKQYIYPELFYPRELVVCLCAKARHSNESITFGTAKWAVGAKCRLLRVHLLRGFFFCKCWFSIAHFWKIYWE